MASNTPNLNLLKKDPLTDGNETFNIQTMMNDNWDKIDTAVKKVQDDVANIDPDIPDASTTQKGIVQLSSATNSAIETLAATPKAVKTVADASLPKTGGTVSGDISISGKSTLVGPIDFRNGMDGLGDIKNTGGIRANGIVNFTNRLFVGSGDNNGQPSLSLSIGDNDTGFNHARDGYVDFVANGRTVAFMNEYGRFCVRGDGDDYYDVARDIISLKQSVSNGKSSIASAITDRGFNTPADANFSTMADNIRNIPARMIDGNFNTDYIEISRDYTGTVLTYNFPGVNFTPKAVSIIIGTKYIYNAGQSSSYGDMNPSTLNVSNSFSASVNGASVSTTISGSQVTFRFTRQTSSGYSAGNIYAQIKNFRVIG